MIMPRYYHINTMDDYEITRDGDVINKKTGRILKAQPNGKGYLRFSLLIGTKRKFFFVHRLVAEKYVPNPEGKPQVNHIDGNKRNNKAENLEWVTNFENRQHARMNGFHLSGEKCPWAKLKQKDVDYIRLHPEERICDLAKKFGVARATIGNIRYGKHWK